MAPNDKSAACLRSVVALQKGERVHVARIPEKTEWVNWDFRKG